MIHREIFFKKNMVDCGGTKKMMAHFYTCFEFFQYVKTLKRKKFSRSMQQDVKKRLYKQ